MILSSTVFDCNLLYLPKVEGVSGNLTVADNNGHMPFSIKRVYYLYDVPSGVSRAAHAHLALEQIIIAASGSFDITIDDGLNKKTVHLSRPYFGLHIKPGIWRDISNFSSGSICLVLASEIYLEEDYIREYADFLRFKNVK